MLNEKSIRKIFEAPSMIESTPPKRSLRKPLCMTESTKTILALIKKSGSIYRTAIVKKTGLAGSTVGKGLITLERAGYVERIRDRGGRVNETTVIYIK